MPQLIYIDSFDDQYAGNGSAFPCLKRWTAGGSGMVCVAAGRTNYAVGILGARAQADSYVQKTIPQRKTVYVGVAVNTTYNNGPTGDSRVFDLLEGSNRQIGVYVTSGLALKVVQGDNTVLASTAQVIAASWGYLEFLATIGNSDGAFQLRLNGVTLATGSGADTQNSAAAYVNGIRLGSSDIRLGISYDDLYVAEGQFFGGLKVYALFPNAAGDLTQFSASTSSDWTCVDEVNPNDNADYVYQSGTTSEDLYNYQNLTDSSAPYGIQLWTRHERDDTVVRKFTPQCKSGSTDSAFTEVTTSNGTYADDVQWMGIDPATGLPWTVAGINSAQFGIKITV